MKLILALVGGVLLILAAQGKLANVAHAVIHGGKK